MTAPAPNLSFGDTGEWVLRLQTRLQALGMFIDTPDGTFGEATRAALVQLQEREGLPAEGAVDEQTWAALAAAEDRAGLEDPFAALTVAGAGSGAGADAVLDPATTPVGALSEDQEWQWDGERWQPSDRIAAAYDAPVESADSHVSADGQWVWDGSAWRAVT